MDRLLRLPLSLFPFRHQDEICYVLPLIESPRVTPRTIERFKYIDDSEAAAILSRLRSIVEASDRPLSHVAIAGSVGVEFKVYSTHFWEQAIVTHIESWFQDGASMSSTSICSNFFRFTIELNPYLSFRPMADFVNSRGEGLNPELYDWREYVRRGWLRD